MFIFPASYFFHVCRFFSCRPLHIAARRGLTTVVQVLLSRGAAVMAMDEDGKAAAAAMLICWDENDFFSFYVVKCVFCVWLSLWFKGKMHIFFVCLFHSFTKLLQDTLRLWPVPQIKTSQTAWRSSCPPWSLTPPGRPAVGRPHISAPVSKPVALCARLVAICVKLESLHCTWPGKCGSTLDFLHTSIAVA